MSCSPALSVGNYCSVQRMSAGHTASLHVAATGLLLSPALLLLTPAPARHKTRLSPPGPASPTAAGQTVSSRSCITYSCWSDCLCVWLWLRKAARKPVRKCQINRKMTRRAGGVSLTVGSHSGYKTRLCLVTIMTGGRHFLTSHKTADSLVCLVWLISSYNYISRY